MMTTMKPDQFCMKKRKMIMKRGMRTSLEKVRERKYLDLFHHLTARLGPGSLLLPCELTSLLILEGGTFFQAQTTGGNTEIFVEEDLPVKKMSYSCCGYPAPPH